MKKLSSIIMAVITASAISACGGDSLSEDLKVSELNSAEEKQSFCEELVSKTKSRLGGFTDDACQWAGALAASFAADGEDLVEVCNEGATTCISEADAVDQDEAFPDCATIEDSDEFKEFTDSCTATVGEVYACLDKSIAIIESLFGGAACSSVETFLESDAFTDLQSGEEPELGDLNDVAECAALQETCPAVLEG